MVLMNVVLKVMSTLAFLTWARFQNKIEPQTLRIEKIVSNRNVELRFDLDNQPPCHFQEMPTMISANRIFLMTSQCLFGATVQ